MEKSQRYNEGKPRYSLISYEALEPLVRVMEYGATKYEEDQWRKGGEKLDKLSILDSMQRHVGELIDCVRSGREELDHETRVHIIGHIMANAMIYSYHHVIKKNVIQEQTSRTQVGERSS
jgi:DNA-binding transcriptional regulator/RsmH inhibitor MraZ